MVYVLIARLLHGNAGWKCIQETMLLFILLEMETCQLT